MTTEQAPEEPNADAIVGEKVHQLMWRLKMSQTDMAHHLGVSQTSVGRRLRGETGWTVADIMTAARVLRLPPADLLPRVDEGSSIGYAIRDSNPEPADFGTAPDVPTTPVRLGKVLSMPRRSRSHATPPTNGGRGGDVVRLKSPDARRATSSWAGEADEASS